MNKNIVVLFASMISIVGINFTNGQTFNKPGVTSAQFLKLGVSARAEAMGQAVSSFIDDGSASFYNPSGLMNIKNNDLMVGHTFMPANVGLSFLNIAKRLGDNDAVAFSLIAFKTDEMKVRTVLKPEGTGQTFNMSDYAFGIHYAHNFTIDLQIGFTFRYMHMNQVSGLFSQDSWSADMGIQYDTGLEGLLNGLKIGMVVANFGPEVKFINESYGLPLKYVIGLSRPIEISSGNNLMLGFNWVKAIDEKQKVQLGLEYDLEGFIFLRAGYKFLSDSETWSGGVGIVQRISSLNLKFDYSYSDYALLGALHRITASIGFN
ncbi:MAG: PorV/PorQ family protein [Bacteroidota bacterium]